MTPDASRKSMWWPDDLWERITKAAAELQLKTGENVTVSEWIREACKKELRRQERRK